MVMCVVIVYCIIICVHTVRIVSVVSIVTDYEHCEVEQS